MRPYREFHVNKYTQIYKAKQEQFYPICFCFVDYVELDKLDKS